jgi:cytochrome P450
MRADLASQFVRRRAMSDRAATIDLLNLAAFSESREHALFAELRSRDEIHFNPEDDGPGFWSLVRYDHVSEAVRDHKRFLSGHGTQIKDRRAEGHGHASVHNSDPPLHGQLRNIALPALSRTMIERRETRIEAIARQLIANAPKDDVFDFVERIAVKLPMMVIADVLGVPPEESEALVDWANLMSDVRASNDQQAEARAALYAYFRKLSDVKRAQPADDVSSALVAANMHEEALDAYFMLLTVAGNETTRFLMTGGLAQLIRQPEDFARVAANRALINPMIEEMCRFVSPVTHMRRTASEALDLYGTKVPKGAKIVLWFASANHDERQFVNPETLVIDRNSNHHLGFGQGAHFCVGAHLARLETRIFFDALFDAITHIELIGKPERLPSNWFTGWTTMPVRWS